MSNQDGIRAFHWAALGARSWGSDGQLFVVFPAPVNPDVCFEAAGFTDFDDQGERWDDDYERFVREALAALGEHGEATVHGGIPPAAPSLLDRLRGKPSQTPTPIDHLLWAGHDDNAPCRLEFGRPARAFVQVADGHEVLWIWLDESLVSRWPGLLRRLAGSTTQVETQLDWKHLLPTPLQATPT